MKIKFTEGDGEEWKEQSPEFEITIPLTAESLQEIMNQLDRIYPKEKELGHVIIDELTAIVNGIPEGIVIDGWIVKYNNGVLARMNLEGVKIPFPKLKGD